MTDLNELAGWRPIETLTDADGYVLGWSARDDSNPAREYFIGRRYPFGKVGLVNEATARMRTVTHWRPLSAPPVRAATPVQVNEVVG